MLAPVVAFGGLLAWLAWSRPLLVTPVSLQTKTFKPIEVPSTPPKRVIVKLKESSESVSGTELGARGGARLLRSMRGGRKFLLSTETTDTAKVIEKLRREPGVAYAEQDGYVRASMTPNDEYYRYQWNLPRIGAPGAWDERTGAGVTVAVVDTGVAFENFSDGLGRYHKLPDLAGTRFTTGYDFYNRDAHPNDDNGHGSHVTGTIAQTTNNSRSEAGVAFNATIMPVKVLSAEGYGYVSDVADGITWAADHGAKVINLSLGADSPYTSLEDAVNYARDTKGVIVVAAAGNSGEGRLGYPAAYESVISVGAVRYDKRRTYYSQYGPGLDIMAPGGDTSVDQNADGYGDGILQQTIGLSWGAGDPTVDGDYFLEGTSMAAPHVAAVAALILSAGYDVATVESALKAGAVDLGAAGYDTGYGFGLLSATGALMAASPGPAASMSVPAHSTDRSSGARVALRWSAVPKDSTSILYYRVQYMDRNASPLAWKDWRTFATGVTSADFRARPGHTYYFRTRARDSAGNWGIWSLVKQSIVPFDDGSSSLQRGFGGVYRNASSEYYLGTLRYSRRAGDWMSITTTARRISLIGTGGSHSKAKVYIDGRFIATIDPAKKHGFHQVLFTRAWSGASRRRTLKVVNLATSSRPQFEVDGFGVQRR